MEIKMRRPRRYKHQQKAIDLSKDKIAFAFLMEMGTGKTRPIIETAEHLLKKKEIEALVIFAPNGVQRNWVLNQIPNWCACKYRAAWWDSSPTKKNLDAINLVCARPFDGLRVIAANYESSRSPRFKAFIRKFMKSFSNMAVLDESTRIKSPKAYQTKFVLSLAPLADYRRIMSGLVTPNSPFDIYKQFEWLDKRILGFGSYYAFKAHFAEIEDSPHLLRAIQKKTSGGSAAGLRGNKLECITSQRGTVTKIMKVMDFASAGQIVAEIDDTYQVKAPGAGTISKVRNIGDFVDFNDVVVRMVQAPMLVKKNSDGQPRYKNLDELSKLIAPHSYRVLKKDCLDLPPKVYHPTLKVELTSKQRHAYDSVREEMIAEFEEGEITAALAIVRLMRLQQITGGFWALDGEKAKPIDNNFPKLDAFMEVVQDTQGKFAFWTRFQHENELIANVLRDTYGGSSVVQYYGKINDKMKQKAVDEFSDIVRDTKGNKHFKESKVKYWVGEPHSGGIGLDLITAEGAGYYSNSLNLEDRLQSEDRHHRGGLKHTVNYFDCEAVDSADQFIIKNLRQKLEISTIIMRDEPRSWI